MLNLDMRFNHGILIVELDGELIIETSLKIKQHLTNLIKDNGIKYVVLDLNNVLNIDKSGIKSIIDNYYAVKNNHGKLVLYGLNNLLCNSYKLSIDDSLYQINDLKQAFELLEV